MNNIKSGDFTNLATNYVNRPGYSKQIILAILKYIDYQNKNNFKIADVGAGTGILTMALLEENLNVIAVEPNDAMMKEGIKYTQKYDIQWIKASAENTTLESSSYNWITMGSSFHWTNPKISLPEFYRILKPKGFFTAIWNPRNIENSEFHTEIEQIIYNIAPNIKRISSGSQKNTKNWDQIITSTNHFKDVIFMEVNHIEIMNKERYLNIWKSVNDIRAQAGEEKFTLILQAIEQKIAHLENIITPYKIRAWTAQRVD